MSETKQFRRGDAVIHPRRPEWGDGVVDHATPSSHDGKPAQRVVVKFANQGLVTINTGVAPLLRKEATASMSTTTPAPARKTDGWLASLGQKPGASAEGLAKLPDAMTDPFASLANRLEATLASYRFSTEARSLMDWAVTQTGLNDPLSQYTRHELEQAFPRFARDRDNHLQELVRLIKRQGKAEMLREALSGTRLPAAKNALQRAMRN